MFCIDCGKEVNSRAKYCEYCGARVATQQAPAESPREASSEGATPRVTQATTRDETDFTLHNIQKAFSLSLGRSTMLALVPALLLFIGALMPWISVSYSILGATSSMSAPGTKFGYGVFVLILGIFCALVSSIRIQTIRAMCFLGVGLAAAIDIIVFGVNKGSEVQGINGGLYSSMFNVSVGSGVWVSLLGAILAFVLGIMQSRFHRASTS